MSTTVTKLIVAIALQLTASSINAQYTQPSQYSRWEVGAGLQGLIYQGDLTTHRLGSIETIRPGLLLFGNYKLKPQLKLQASAAIGVLSGNDAIYASPGYRRERNFTFTTLLKEFEVAAQYQLHKSYQADETLLYPYISAGLGLSILNVKTDFSKITSKLSLAEPNILVGIVADVAKGPPSTLLYIPLTVGVRKMYSPRLDMFAEAKYRLTTTDYLDGVSQAAGSTKNDKYYSINVGVVYKFYNNKGIACPKY
jgi:hypothetical protein